MKKLPPSRLSESVLWDLQKTAYQEFGIESWTKEGVPFHVTNNSLIAKQYAAIAFPYLEKGSASFLELGGGSGKFAYLFLSELSRLGDISSVRYLLTDFSEKNVLFWKNHPLFSPFIEKGILHPILYDPLTSLSLPFSPEFVIANYFFDSIAQDLFKQENGKLFEGQVTISLPEEKGIDPAAVIGKMSWEYSYLPIDNPASYFHSSELGALFDFYRKDLPDGTFLFPSGGCKALFNLLSVCTDPFTLLTADYSIFESRPLQMRLHRTFSFPVNFQAITKFFDRKGGEAYLKSKEISRVTVGLFSTGKILKTSLEYFKKQYFGPLIKKESSSEEVLNCLEDANWDATLFFSLLDRIEVLFDLSSQKEKKKFISGFLKIRSHFYPLFKEESILLEKLAHFLQKIGQKEESEQLVLLAKSLMSIDPLHSSSSAEVLQIGAEIKGLQFGEGNLTKISQDLASLHCLGSFDLILFSFQDVECDPLQKNELVQQVEKEFPNLDKKIYTDQDLEFFLDALDSTAFLHSKYLVRFIFNLESTKQITRNQAEKAFVSLEKKKLISPEELNRFLVRFDKVDYFQILMCALKYHLKSKGVLKILFPRSFQEARFFNEIIVNPYLDCKEENYISHEGEEFLLVTVNTPSAKAEGFSRLRDLCS